MNSYPEPGSGERGYFPYNSGYYPYYGTPGPAYAAPPAYWPPTPKPPHDDQPPLPNESLLDMSIASSVGGLEEGPECAICAPNRPDSRTYPTLQRQRAHAAKHRRPNLPDPFTRCFPDQEEPEESPGGFCSSTPTKAGAPPSLSVSFSSITPSLPSVIPSPPPPITPSLPPVIPPRAGYPASSTALNASFNTTIGDGGPGDLLMSNMLCNYLNRRRKAGFVVGHCAFPGCASTAAGGGDSRVQHVLTHGSRAFFSCATCGYRCKSASGIWTHNRNAHPGEKPAVEDLRLGDPGLDEQATRLTYQCYPILYDSAFMLGGGSAPILSALAGLRDRGESVVCAQCRQEVAASGTLPLEMHLLGHYPAAVFECTQCRWTGNEPVAHYFRDHPGSRKFSRDLGFMDNRSEHEPQLFPLLRSCYPGVSVSREKKKEPGLMPPPPRPRRVVEKKPELPKLHSYGIIFKAANRKGLLPYDKCQYPGCGLKLTSWHSPLDHLVTHTKRPTTECGECGYRNSGPIHNHFRSRHPDIPKINALDIRHLIQDQLMATLKQMYPGLLRVEVLYPTLQEADSLPTRFLRTIAEMAARTSLRCHFPDCPNPVLSDGDELALERHVLGHHPDPAFRCMSCRYEGNDIYGHSVATHVRKGSTAALEFKYEDGRAGAESQLVVLAHRCFPLGPTAAEKHWWSKYLSSSGLELSAAVGEVCSRAGKAVKCRIPACTFVLRKPRTGGFDATNLHSHILAHWDTPLFACQLCAYQGQGMGAHVESCHESSRCLGLGALFLDRRPAQDAALAALLRLAFPA